MERSKGGWERRTRIGREWKFEEWEEGKFGREGKLEMKRVKEEEGQKEERIEEWRSEANQQIIEKLK